jgi:hypothetical protein
MSQNTSSSLLAQPEAVNDGDHCIKKIPLTTEYSAIMYNNFHGAILMGKHFVYHSAYFHICYLIICFTGKFYNAFTDKADCNYYFLVGTA